MSLSYAGPHPEKLQATIITPAESAVDHPLAKEFYDVTTDEVKSGWPEGPVDPQLLPAPVPVARRFKLRRLPVGEDKARRRFFGITGEPEMAGQTQSHHKAGVIKGL